MTTYEPPHSAQSEDILRPWIDPHHLKKINGEWWKGQRKVITGNTETQRRHYQKPSRSTRLWTPWNIPYYGPSSQVPLVAQLGDGSPELRQGMRRMPTPQN
jgi:hypothetical protein